MDDAMCQTRQEIIDEDSQIQQALKELEKLRSREHNGKTRQEILEYEMLIENRIAGKQTSQDVSSIKGTVEDIAETIKEHEKFPSIIYQLLKMPTMGWSLLLATILTIWLVGQVESDGVVHLLNAAHIEATASDVHAVVGFVVSGLIVTAARRYVQFIEEKEGD